MSATPFAASAVIEAVAWAVRLETELEVSANTVVLKTAAVCWALAAAALARPSASWASLADCCAAALAASDEVTAALSRVSTAAAASLWLSAALAEAAA